MATQTHSAIRAPSSQYLRCSKPPLTPPYHNDPKPDRLWSGQGGQGGSDDNYSVSVPPAGEPRSERTTPQMSPIQSYPPIQPLYRIPPAASSNPRVSLPPLRHLSRTPPTLSDRRYGNPFEVHSILNPQAELVEQQRALKRSNSQMDSPPPADTQNSQSLPFISRHNSVNSTQSTQEGRQHARSFQPLERCLVRPLYPEKGIRTHSLSRLNPLTGTIDAQQSPFLTACTRLSEMMTTQPSLSTPPAGGLTHYSLPIAPKPSPNTMCREVPRPSLTFLHFGSASPIYSSYSQPASVASSRYDNHNTQGQCGPMQRHIPIHDSRHVSVSMESERNSMIAMAPSNQSSVQLMTIQSQDGSLHNIQVETQTASKGADEKRRRNAGASARFRARRKEKEREASISISRLEQNVRNSNGMPSIIGQRETIEDRLQCRLIRNVTSPDHYRPASGVYR